MTIFDDIRKDREAGGEWAYGDETNQDPAFRRMSRLDRLERAILDHADWLMHEIKVCEAAGDAIGVRAYGRTLAAFRAACGEADQ